MNKKKILMADDNAELLKLVKTYLDVRGFQVTTVQDGWACVHQVKAERPDLLLLDLSMPKMDGLQTIQMMMTLGLVGAFPILLLTGTAEKEVVLKALKLGVVDYIVKPFDLKALMERLHKHLADINFLDVKDLLQSAKSPASEPAKLAQIAAYAEGRWDAYFVPAMGTEFCLLVERGLSPSSFKTMSEERANASVRVYVKRGAHWACAWPAQKREAA